MLQPQPCTGDGTELPLGPEQVGLTLAPLALAPLAPASDAFYRAVRVLEAAHEQQVQALSAKLGELERQVGFQSRFGTFGTKLTGDWDVVTQADAGVQTEEAAHRRPTRLHTGSSDKIKAKNTDSKSSQRTTAGRAAEPGEPAPRSSDCEAAQGRSAEPAPRTSECEATQTMYSATLTRSADIVPRGSDGEASGPLTDFQAAKREDMRGEVQVHAKLRQPQNCIVKHNSDGSLRGPRYGLPPVSERIMGKMHSDGSSNRSNRSRRLLRGAQSTKSIAGILPACWGQKLSPWVSTGGRPNASRAQLSWSPTRLPVPTERQRSNDTPKGGAVTDKLASAANSAALLRHSSGSPTCHRCVLSPLSRIRFAWDMLAFVCVLVDIWITTFDLIYLDSLPEVLQQAAAGVLSFFVLDMLLNFRTGYVSRGALVMDGPKSMVHYLKFWFWLDLVSTFPFEVMMDYQKGRWFKALRFLKMCRVMRSAREIGNAQHPLGKLRNTIERTVTVISCVIGIWMLLHIHGSAWVAITGTRTSDLGEALYNYYMSLQWSSTAFAIGTTSDCCVGSGCQDPCPVNIWALEMFINVERVVVGTVLLMYLLLKLMVDCQEEAKVGVVKSAAMRYFRQHQVSVETQMQIMYSLDKTRSARQTKHHFEKLLSKYLPYELCCRVREELWSSSILSLSFLYEVSSWHTDFLLQLCLVVHEEVMAPKTTLCKAGQASMAAYYVMEGCLSLWGPMYNGTTFKQNTWVGEMSLLSPPPRRHFSVIALDLTRLMAVPADQFHQLVERLGMKAALQDYCQSTACHGICGYCGSVGDHFSHACPGFQGPSTSAPKQRSGDATDSTFRTCIKDDELNMFLHMHGLTPLAPMIAQMGVKSYGDLEALDFDELRDEVDVELSQESNVLEQIELLESLVHMELSVDGAEEVEDGHHFIFLSHYKVEAGTEAALMRRELEQTMEDEFAETHAANRSIFLDSEDLSDLAELEARVRNTQNFVLLLTAGVLTRPWCLVEIVAAVKAGVHIIPVMVHKAGADFEFPDEEFYAKLVGSQFLDAAGHEMLRLHGIELQQVELALKSVFQKIALPYSPHRPERIRHVEVNAILKQCKVSPDCAWVSISAQRSPRGSGSSAAAPSGRPSGRRRSSRQGGRTDLAEAFRHTATVARGQNVAETYRCIGRSAPSHYSIDSDT